MRADGATRASARGVTAVRIGSGALLALFSRADETDIFSNVTSWCPVRSAECVVDPYVGRILANGDLIWSAQHNVDALSDIQFARKTSAHRVSVVVDDDASFALAAQLPPERSLPVDHHPDANWAGPVIHRRYDNSVERLRESLMVNLTTPKLYAHATPKGHFLVDAPSDVRATDKQRKQADAQRGERHILQELFRHLFG